MNCTKVEFQRQTHFVRKFRKGLTTFITFAVLAGGIMNCGAKEKIKEKSQVLASPTQIAVPQKYIGEISGDLESQNISRKYFIGMTSLRTMLTEDYANLHYNVSTSKISPKIVVIHWTDSRPKSLKIVVNYFKNEKLQEKRMSEADFGFSRRFRSNKIWQFFSFSSQKLNVGTQFVVDRDGKIYQLFEADDLLQHTIGLNWCAIGVENIGSTNYPLTNKQLESNLKLISILKRNYPGINLVIGHYQYRKLENTPYFIEKNKNYRSYKIDPGKKFMRRLTNRIKSSGLDVNYINP